ncbi:dihydrolipoamide acetyltransferase family protein [Alkalihalobacillus sp. BA299]|uniref:dihydrolipoamide acetyltransferase family protein n=1 Tax=Alkalihalobacillus sp. BA299 TaxID=2815938 RepID=UPI001ADCB688|nr:dihydrolipoamide acetyltransferase family protein [Alkalihalobacillus sp. BA299]
MKEQVLMPQLGESVTEGTVVKWFVKAGDQVKKYEPICEVATDKVNAEVPSVQNGTISEIIVQEDETVSVGELICYITTDATGSEPTADNQVVDASSTFVENKENESSGTKKRYSPAVLKLAQENNLNLEDIEGTGNGGRITRKDILEILEGKRQVAATAVQEVEHSIVSEVPNSEPIQEVSKKAAQNNRTPSSNVSHDGDQIIPVTSVRKTIANRMVESKQTAPHAWIMAECDVTNLVEFRNKIKGEFKSKEGINLTYLPFFIKAVVESLKEYPILNSQWTDEQIIVKKAINISVAVATEKELFVPVIKDADQKSIFGLVKSLDEIARKTREGKLSMNDMSGGTFTVNNTGSFGSILSNPIINQPQAAILSVEAIVKRPVVKDNMIAVRDMMNICLSLDHRVLDGLVCGRFLQSVKEKIEGFGSDTKIY